MYYIRVLTIRLSLLHFAVVFAAASPPAGAIADTTQKPVTNQAKSKNWSTPYLDTLEARDRKRRPRVAVLAVRNAATPRQSIPKADTIRFLLNDQAILTVRDLRLALRRAKREFKDLRLYVDDIMLPMAPVHADTILWRDTALVRFQLQRTLATEPTWQLFYRIPGKYAHRSTFSIGFDTGQLEQAFQAPVHLELVQKNWLWVGALLLLVLVGGFLWLADRSNFIRSDIVRSPQDPNLAGSPAVTSPEYRSLQFSLAKSQLACWTLLLVSAYLMIFLVTSALPQIPGGLLGLLGISLANGFFSGFINRNPTPTPGSAPITDLWRDNIGRSRGWLRDVLTDSSNGINLARVQFLVFNAVVALFVIRHVLKNWSLPELDSSILALISISSAGFLAQKGAESSYGSAKQTGATTVIVPGQAIVPAPAAAPPVVALTTPAATAASELAETPTSRADEDDNAAPPTAESQVEAPPSSRALG